MSGPARPAVGVPGPPRARRRVGGGTDASARAAEAGGWGALAAAMPRLLGDVILLGKDLGLDPRVPARAKLVPLLTAAAAWAGVRWPAPGAARAARSAAAVVVAAWSARRFLKEAGYERVYEAWRGSEMGLATVLALAGVER